jgi:acetylornithine/succinyldiaminopimelate/putrescine aminotransferase
VFLYVHKSQLFVSEHGDRICGFLFEPIQGEAGVRAYHAISDVVMLTVVSR